MTRLQAFTAGLLGLDKEAKGKKGGVGVPGAALLGNDILWAALLGLPIAAGAGVGALASKMSSPAGNLRTAQKELVLSELTESLAELKRRKAIAEAAGTEKVTAFNERPLHI